MKRVTEWLAQKWSRTPDADRERQALAHAYAVTFSTPEGKRVLQHFLDSAYCTIYEGKDPIEMAQQNGVRRFVHEILKTIDYGEAPEKYRVPIQTEPVYAAAR